MYILHLGWLSLSSIARAIQPIAFSFPFILLSVCSFFNQSQLECKYTFFLWHDALWSADNDIFIPDLLETLFLMAIFVSGRKTKSRQRNNKVWLPLTSPRNGKAGDMRRARARFSGSNSSPRWWAGRKWHQVAHHHGLLCHAFENNIERHTWP